MLSNSLMKNFIKSMAPAPKPSTINSIYGTLIVNNGEMHVQMDGSQEQTPVVSTVTGETGDRVTVTVNNHVAVVEGNLTEPAINKRDLETEIPKYADTILKDIENILGMEQGGISKFVADTNLEFQKYNDFLGSTMTTEFTLETILGGQAEGTVINSLVQTAGSNSSKIEGMYNVFGISEKDGQMTSAVVNRVSTVEQDLGKFKLTVESTYQTADGVQNLISQFVQTDKGFASKVSSIISGEGYLTSEDTEDFLKANALEPYLKTEDASVIAESAVSQTKQEISSTVTAEIVSRNLATTDDIPTDDDIIAKVESNIKQTASSIRLAVSNVVATDYKSEFDKIEGAKSTADAAKKTADDAAAKVTRDAIVELINGGSGTSRVRISADEIILDGWMMGNQGGTPINVMGFVQTNDGAMVLAVDKPAYFYNGIYLGGVWRNEWPSGGSSSGKQIVTQEMFNTTNESIGKGASKSYTYTITSYDSSATYVMFPGYVTNQWLQVTNIARSGKTVTVTITNLDESAGSKGYAHIHILGIK